MRLGEKGDLIEASKVMHFRVRSIPKTLCHGALQATCFQNSKVSLLNAITATLTLSAELTKLLKHETVMIWLKK